MPNRPLRVLIASDKYKGSLTATQAAQAIQRALQRSFPDEVECDLCPIADGGEGTTEAMITALGGAWVTAEVCDAIGRPLQARYGWVADRREAVMEMSAASGLALVSDQPLVPETASTHGTGLLMKHAIERGAKRIVVGIGGSATNDGGIGMAAALGYEFLDSFGNRIEPNMANLERVTRIQRVTTAFPAILVACDVSNPLLGEQGASAVYGPQKGVKDVAWFEHRMRHLADLVAHDLQIDPRELPGAGAAGGLGFGLMAFCGAELTSGFDLIAAQVDLARRIGQADLIITGEGRIDAQTLHGKGPAGVARLAREMGKPVVAFAGSVADMPVLSGVFHVARGIKSDDIPLPEAMRRAEELLEATVAGCAGEIRELAAGGRRF